VSPADAHKELEQLRVDGLVDVHVEILCPECDRTLRVYDLGQEIPLGELIEDESCEGQPFEVTEDDLFLTYSPSKELLLQVNRTGRSDRSKKKTGILARLRATWSALRLRTTSTKRNARFTSALSTAPGRKSRLEAPGPIMQ
jgi:hypothetical protein